MKAAGAPSLKDLRALPAAKLLELTAQPAWARFEAIADNYQVPAKDLINYVDAGEQAHVPLLQGWVSEERSARSLLGNLATNKHYAWEQADNKLSELMENYFANFIKTGDPNSPGLPTWPAYAPDAGFQIMNLNVDSCAVPEARQRYLLLDQILRQKQ